MRGGALRLLACVVYAAGGVSSAVTTLNEINPELISPQGADGILSFPFMASFWVLVCFGVVGLPHTAVRCKAVHRGIIIGTVVVAILMFSMHLAGALGRAILPDLTIPDTVIPTLMVKVMPPFAAGIFLAAPLAAIMSTVNAQLLQTSATIIKDLYLRMRPQNNVDQTRLTRASGVLTFIIGLLLILCAFNPPVMLIWLNLRAFGALQVVFLWPLVLGLYWSKANATGAMCSIIAGISFFTVCEVMQITPFGFLAIVPSLVISGIVFLIANRFGKPSTIADASVNMS